MAEPRARSPWPRFWWLVAPLAALLAFRDLGHVAFVADARFLIADNRFAHALSYWRATLVHDYFWSSSGNIIPYWRPLTKLSWLVEWQAFDSWAGGYALVNLAWHAVGVTGAGALARRVGLTRPAAIATAVCYALHPVMIAPVSMIMARSDVVAAAASTWAVVAWLAWREAGARRRAWAALHVACLLVAFGSKEAAIALPLVIVAWCVIDHADLRSAAPAVVIGGAYFVLRRSLLEHEAAGLSGTALAIDPVRIFTGLGVYLWNTFPLALGSSVRDVSFREARGPAMLARAAVAVGALVAVVVRAARRRERASLALACWTVAGVLPVLVARDISVVDLTGKYPLADRWLAFSLAPALVLWAVLATQALERLSGVPKARAVAAGAVACWAAALLVRSSADRAEFQSDLAMLDNEDRAFYFAVPERYRTDEDRCRYEERKVVRALFTRGPGRVPELAEHATAACGDKPELLADWLDALVELGRYKEAEPIARKLVLHPPRDLRSHGHVALTAGIAFAENDERERSEPLLERAAALGAIACRGFVPLAERARAQRHVEAAATYVEVAWRCGGERDASLLLAGATWLVAAGDRDRAARFMTAVPSGGLPPDQEMQRATLERALSSGAPAASR